MYGELILICFSFFFFYYFIICHILIKLKLINKIYGMALVDACGISHTLYLIIYHHLWVMVNILVWSLVGCTRLILRNRTNAEAVATAVAVLRVNVTVKEGKALTEVRALGAERTRPIEPV